MLILDTSFATKAAYFSLAISSHRTVATITYESVDPSPISKIKMHVRKISTIAACILPYVQEGRDLCSP